MFQENIVMKMSWKMLFFSYFLHTVCSINFEVKGPGLSPEFIVLPARYFFITVLRPDSSFRADLLTVKISGESSSGNCKIWMEVLDRKDDSFIVRYRLYESCYNFQIVIKYNRSHIGKSPYVFKGYILHEHCYCPERNFDKWSSSYGCPKDIAQLTDDLKPFKNVNMTKTLQIVKRHYNHPGSMSLCHYSIRNNKLYRKCYGQHVGFHIFSDAIILSILRKVHIPDQSFLINLGDWPLVKNNGKMIPVFSWCGSKDTMDIVLPTYDITESTLENMGRLMLDMLSIQGNIGKKWDEKIPMAFWRGRDSNKERLKLVDISRQYPSLYNVTITNFFFFRDRENVYGPKAPHVSFFKFFDYKYQINIDGTVAAYRFPYLLVGDSLVLKQESQYYEHFYGQLEPGIHYLSFKNDLSDLTEKIQWAIENDDQARIISKNGREFAQNSLMPQNILCYYALALQEWSKRIIDPMEIFEDMEYVPQKDEQQCICTKEQEIKDEL